MKTIALTSIAIASVLLAATTFSQVATGPVPGGSVGSSNVLAGASAGRGAWQAFPRDSGSTEWQQVQMGTNLATGQLEVQTNHYTEIANNLNFMDTSGAWEPSIDSIRLMTNTGGAAALFGPTKVYFPATLGGTEGPITITTLSNTAFKIQPI